MCRLTTLLIKKSFLILLCFISAVSLNVITIRQGSIRGSRYDGYISFQGIPYATVGDDHFKAATRPAPSWYGVRESQQSACTETSPASECLLLDVNMPYVTLEPLPVLVWVKGDGTTYNTGLLVKQGIIVVVVGHRFGIGGFLCSDDERLQGNAGIKDVVLALQWVRDTISEFSGNPAKVVVGGQNFGAAMVEALTLSPLTHKLYNGVIIQSGSILSPWAFQYDANERVRILGRWFTGSDPISNLLSGSLDNLLPKADLIKYPYYTFGLCVEQDFKNGERFLTDSPINLLSQGKVQDVSMLIGYNNDRDYIFQTILKTVRAVKKISVNMPFLLPEELNFSSLDDRHVLVQMQKLYFNGNITMDALLEYHRDAYILNHIHRSVRLHAAASALPIYYYQFSHPGTEAVETEITERDTTAEHLGEARYLFPSNDQEYVGHDSKLQRDLIMLWSNFIKNLDPNPRECSSRHWRPAARAGARLLLISHNTTMAAFPYHDQMDFWDTVYDRYYYDKHAV